MRFTRTILEVEVSTVVPWTGPLMVGAEFYYRKNLDAVQEAVQKAILYAPAVIEAETGQAIQEFIGSILDTLIMSAVIVGASSALGATIGGVVGFFFGGAGALPGVALGAEAGFDVGMFLLEWLGLAFLLEHVASKLGEVVFLVGPNVKLAWDAAGKPSAQRGILIESAARGLARAIGVLFRLVLEGIVLFLLAKGTAKLGELTGKLKASKLGKGFGEWVERNWQKLVDDPRFNPKLKARAKPALSGGGASEAETPLTSAQAKPTRSSGDAPPPASKGETPIKGARGPASGREFDPDAAGGPIVPKSTDGVTIDHAGIDSVERHLSRFGEDPHNEAMITRLRAIADGQMPPTQEDLNFFTHELDEFQRYKNLGFETGLPDDPDAQQELWNNAHTAALEDYGLKDVVDGKSTLYHPDCDPRLSGD